MSDIELKREDDEQDEVEDKQCQGTKMMTDGVDLELGELQRRRALLLGESGKAWLAGLEALVLALTDRWGLRLEAPLAGGTEALVYRVRNHVDEPLVLKLGLPGSLATETAALRLAAGRGYVGLVAADPANDALLLEHLGGKLIDAGLSVRRQQEIVLATVQAAWHPVADASAFTTGAAKARWHLEFIAEQWSAQAAVCTTRLRDAALACCQARLEAFDPATSVLVHGDAHAWNTLRVPGEDEAWKLVDPDGYFMEPAYDLGISMREWIDEYLAGEPRVLGEARARWLSDETGIDEEPIWQWGLIELVSTGFVYLQLDEPAAAKPYFELAEAWVP
ncbi:MAG: phosphotransferase [Pseudomonadota bacterium]